MKNIKFICVIASLIIAFAITSFGQSATETLQSGREKIKSPKTLFEGMSEIMSAKELFITQGFADQESGELLAASMSFSTSLVIEIDFANAPKTKEYTTLNEAYDVLNIAARQSRATVNIVLKNYDSAIEDFGVLIEKKVETIGQIYSLRGMAYKEKKDYEKASSDFNSAIKLNPKAAWNFAYLGDIFAEQGDINKAMTNFYTAILVDPKFPLSYTFRGHAYVKSGEFQKAIADLNKSIRLNPKDANAFLYRGLAYEGTSLKNKKTLATADFKKALKLDSNLEEAKEQLKKLGVK
jgi:tetratricopeptide (TPR) repeat protein